MKATNEQEIRRIITRGKFGDVFMVSTFDKYDAEYVTKLLPMFEKEGLFTRVSQGVYVKMRKTRFGVVYPTAAELVSKIAQRDKAQVIPTGETAANRLGFTTQVPMNTSFLTTGSTRKLTLGQRVVTLKHGAPRNFAYKGKLMPELVQALRSIGEKNITPQVESHIKKLLLESPEPQTFDHDIRLAPMWIQKLIKNSLQK